MVDPDKESGCAEPHTNSAERHRRYYYRDGLYMIVRLTWRCLTWPRQWWRSGDHNRRTANATVLLALGTLALAAVNLGMLVEMRRGGGQQHADTLAALGKTDDTILAIKTQGGLMREQLEQMRIAAAVTKDDSRAIVVDSITIDGPIEQKGTEIIFGLGCKFKNVGKTTALNVMMLGEIFTLDAPDRHPRSGQQELCDLLLGESKPAWFAKSIGPNEPPTECPQQRGFQVAAQTSKSREFIVAGCIDYGLIFGDKHKQTGFAYEISSDVPIDTDHLPITTEHLRLINSRDAANFQR